MKLQSFASILLQQSREAFLLFEHPLEVISADTISQVNDCLARMREKLDAGYYLAGYLAYEAAAGLNPAMKKTLATSIHSRPSLAYPILFFGVYANVQEVGAEDWSSVTAETHPGGAQWPTTRWQADIAQDEYAKAIASIKARIAAGDTYQVNYSFRLHTAFNNDPLTYFKALQQAQSANYSAYLNLGRYHICSASPELFFQMQDGEITAKPMKGTINRGLHSTQDADRALWLKNSEKNRAENLMIVDMIRNDLGCVAETGSVKVDSLFDIETYPTVFQMTSSVRAQSPHHPIDVLKQIFPCASITGAPKISTMKIIAELEHSPRGIYTGSIGYLAPNGDALFNVAIRTVLIDSEKQQATYGVGGGIVWDSTVEDEFDECHIKAEILTRKPPDIRLLESLRMEADGNVFLLENHVQRMQDAAQYFGFPFSEKGLKRMLANASQHITEAQKIQLWLDSKGNFSIKASALGSKLGQTLRVSPEKSATQSRFIYHKTSQRQFYQALTDKYLADDVLIVNEQGNLTESCSANLVLELDGKLLTPSLDQGLLNGTFRQYLLDQNRIEEAVLEKADLNRATAIYLINSVRGWMKLLKLEEGLYSIDREGLELPSEFGNTN